MASGPAESDGDVEVAQPGLRRLREVAALVTERAAPSHPGRNALAGLTVMVSNVPQGMANALLAGTNPIYGLYANIVPPIVGGILSSTVLMVINNTSAVSLVAGQALPTGLGERRDQALFLMVILAGVIATALGLLRLGRLTRFVSFSVMTGFLAGIAVVLVLSQLPTLAGVSVDGDGVVAETAELLGGIGRVHLPSLAAGAAALALAAGLPRLGLRGAASLVAIVASTALVALAGFEGVATVGDVGEIDGGLPLPAIPSLSVLSLDLVTGAFSLAIVVLVQGAGVSQSVPNPDGSRRDSSRDFVAQGAANVASGLFRGLPVGGSLGGTALSVSAGGRGRWAAIFSGLWTALVVIALAGLVSLIVMPALGALLVLAGLSAIDRSDIASVWRAGWPSRVSGGATFVATLLLPIQVAVGFGVVLSVLLFVTRTSTDVSVVELRRRPDGRIDERQAPRELADRTVTVLDVYGDLFFAGARTLERLLPSPRGADRPVVVLRLRGRSELGATLAEVLASYAEKLDEVGGRLYLTGVAPQVRERLVRSGYFKQTEAARVYAATSILLESTGRALTDATDWLEASGEP